MPTATCQNAECSEEGVVKEIDPAIAENIAAYPPLYCGTCNQPIDDITP